MINKLALLQASQRQTRAEPRCRTHGGDTETDHTFLKPSNGSQSPDQSACRVEVNKCKRQQTVRHMRSTEPPSHRPITHFTHTGSKSCLTTEGNKLPRRHHQCVCVFVCECVCVGVSVCMCVCVCESVCVVYLCVCVCECLCVFL